MTRNKRYANIIIAVEGSGEVKRIRIPRWHLPARKLGALCLVLATVTLSTHQIFVSGSMRDYRAISQKNTVLKQNLRVICDAFSDMDTKRERLDQYGQKLRFMTRVSDTARGITPETESYETREVATKRSATDICRDFTTLRAQAMAIASDMDKAETQARELMTTFMKQETLLAATPRVKPTDGIVLSGFGNRLHPIDLVAKHHDGIDIAAPEGLSIEAPGDGTVVFAGVKKGYGNAIEIRHRPDLTTLYGHLSRIDVTVEQKVKGPRENERGTKIGEVGSTGKSTGPHLHYETRINGTPVDPAGFILDE